MSADGIWYVKLADGDVDRLTLDQLDEAFQKGQIDESTKVLGEGATQWTKLGELLGSSEPAAPPATPAPAPRPPVAAATQQGTAAPRPIGAHPVTVSPAPMTAAPIARSLRPVSVDLSDVDLANLRGGRSSRKRLVTGAVGAMLALGTTAFVVTKHGTLSSHSDPAPQFVAAAAAPPPEPAPRTAPEAVPAASPSQAAIAGPSSVMDPTTNRLTEDQRKKLLEAEKTAKSHQKAHGAGGGGARHTKEKSSTFTTNGNKFDPLNSNL